MLFLQKSLNLDYDPRISYFQRLFLLDSKENNNSIILSDSDYPGHWDWI